MTDIALYMMDFGGDVQIRNGDYASDNGLVTAVIVSLFTDARAPDDAILPQNEISKRGWWGDIDGNAKTGSLLWLLRREKLLPEVAKRAEDYCKDALKWMVDEGICEKISVQSEIQKPDRLALQIQLTRGNSKKYSYLWGNVKDETIITNDTQLNISFAG